MPLNITARAVTKDEVLDMGTGGPIVGATGEVLLQMGDGAMAYRFIMTGENAREVGKALIAAGWEAMRLKFGAVGAIKEALNKEKRA